VCAAAAPLRSRCRGDRPYRRRCGCPGPPPRPPQPFVDGPATSGNLRASQLPRASANRHVLRARRTSSRGRRSLERCVRFPDERAHESNLFVAQCRPGDVPRHRTSRADPRRSVSSAGRLDDGDIVIEALAPPPLEVTNLAALVPSLPRLDVRVDASSSPHAISKSRGHPPCDQLGPHGRSESAVSADPLPLHLASTTRMLSPPTHAAVVQLLYVSSALASIRQSIATRARWRATLTEISGARNGSGRSSCTLAKCQLARDREGLPPPPPGRRIPRHVRAGPPPARRLTPCGPGS